MITSHKCKPFGHRFPNPSLSNDGTKEIPGWCADCNEATKIAREAHNRTDIVSACEKHLGELEPLEE